MRTAHYPDSKGVSIQRPPLWTETPTWTETPWTETPQKEDGTRQDLTSYRNPPWTDTCKNITSPKLCLRAVKILIDNHYKTIYGPLIRTALLTLNMQLSLVSIQNATVCLFLFEKETYWIVLFEFKKYRLQSLVIVRYSSVRMTTNAGGFATRNTSSVSNLKSGVRNLMSAAEFSQIQNRFFLLTQRLHFKFNSPLPFTFI